MKEEENGYDIYHNSLVSLSSKQQPTVEIVYFCSDLSGLVTMHKLAFLLYCKKRKL